MSLIKRLISGFSRNYIELEIWSESQSKKQLKKYVNRVTEVLERGHEGIDIIDKWYSNYLEIYRHSWLGVFGIKSSGYVVRLRGADPIAVKETCMGLEIDGGGKRISDIDVYLSDNSKVSRKG